MKSKKQFLIILSLLIIALIPLASAKSGSMKLLAVSEINNTYKGSIADLTLEIIPGTGRVFMDTFPLTKFDTQISTRFAKEIACSHIEKNCEKYDFFYTIDANSPIIAGASAGGAISILTISLLEDIELNKETAITGTINSGGLIGPVGGVKEKIEAAKKEGLKKVLIPKGGKISISENETIPIENLSRELEIEIIEVSTLTQVIEEFTGKKIQAQEKDIEINTEYKNTMQILAKDLCQRTKELSNITSYYDIKIIDNNSFTKAKNLSIKGEKAINEKLFYSAASYCFGANVELSYILLSTQNPLKEDIKDKILKVKENIKSFREKLKKDQIKTLTDLESYMVVTERLIEAEDFCDISLEQLNNTNSSLHNLAYSIERLNSASSWAKFLDHRGKEFNLNKEVLEKSCKLKLMESEERYQYVNLYFPASLEHIRKQLDYAYDDLKEENFELCIFKAGKAKANLDMILTSFYIDQDNLDSLINQKLDIVKNYLIKQTKKGFFPVLGYSYYEYADILKEEIPYSSMLYAEYALEMSNLELYFKEKDTTPDFLKKIKSEHIWVLLTGITLGILITIIIQKISKIRQKPSKKQVPAGKKR